MAAPYGGQRTPQTSTALTAANIVATTDQFINGRFISDALPVGVHLITTPSATSIIAAIPNGTVGDTFECFIDNQLNPQNRTLVPGAGCTMFGSTTINLGTFVHLLGIIRNTGAPAVDLAPNAGPESGDSWSTVMLTSTVATTSATPVSITGMSFTPVPGKRYLVKTYLMLRSSATNCGCQPGFSWPTSMTDGAGWMNATLSSTGFANRSWGTLNTQVAAATAVPTLSVSHYAEGVAMLITNSGTTGSFQLVFQSELGNSVSIEPGSVLMYQEY